MVISAAVAPVHSGAAFTSEMITQGLMFESVFILGEQDNWLNIKMEDGYEGWIHHFYISENTPFQEAGCPWIFSGASATLVLAVQKKWTTI